MAVIYGVNNSLYIDDSLYFEKQSRALKAQWVTPRNYQQLSAIEPALMFYGSLDSVFHSASPLNAALITEKDEIQYDSDICLLITGFELPLRGLDVWNGAFGSDSKHVRGNAEDGNLRSVYEYVGKESGLTIRAGVTVHHTGGTWSSWPAHEFEMQALMAPTQLFPHFSEIFAYITNPCDMWGIRVSAPSKAETRYQGGVKVFRDRDICDVPLGAHPVVAAPGTRLAYIWAYVGGWDKF